MKRVGRTFLILLLILLFAIPMFVFAGGGGERSGQDYPTRPVELLVPMGAGGTHDLVSRTIIATVHKYLGQPMTVTLRPGASGVIGTTEIAGAAPDGYRLLFAGLGPNTAVPLAQQVPYTPESFIPVAMVSYSPVVLVVPGNSPYQTVDQLVAAINARPGQLNYATSGAFGNNHVPLAMIWNSYGVLGRITPVHYDGGGPQLVAVLGGQVDAATVFHSQIIDHVKTGALRALAVTDTQRIPADEADGVFANVPTFTELGHPSVVFRMWRAVMAPAGTPEPVINHLRNVFRQLSTDPEFIELNARIGERADQWVDGPEFRQQWAAERATIEPVIRMIQQVER